MSLRSNTIEAGKCVLLALFVAATTAFSQPIAPTSASPAAGATRIGYIDVKRLIDNAPQFVEAKAKLDREFASRDASIKADDDKLSALKQRYERDNLIMTHDDAESLKRLIEATERENKRRRDEARAELSERAKEESNRNLQLINDTAIEYARTQGFDIVVASQAVLYASPRVDITDAVLQRLKQLGSGNAKP